MIHFSCTCGNALFFENTICLQCGACVAYDLDSNRMVTLGGDDGFVLCRNGPEHGACNWTVPAGSEGGLCQSCHLNRTIPDLSIPGNLEAWRKMEAAKRRVLYTLARLGLRPMGKQESPEGVAFDLLSPTAAQPVMTGHLNGVITMNLLEANDSYRENARADFREPYRTLVGHFQHELGHYYWDRFFQGRAPEDPLWQSWRELFGDETADYLAALQSYHAQGPSSGWAERFITAYASCHPWEDWAETWAQYLHILDGVETAGNFGWKGDQVPIPFTPFSAELFTSAGNVGDLDFTAVLNGWAKLAPALNEIAASLGHPNLYPFVLSPISVRKISFVHEVVRQFAREGGGKPAAEVAAPASPAEQPLAA
jgi:hypothetical protein